MNILDKIVHATALRVKNEKALLPQFECNPNSKPFAFENKLKSPKLSFICEVKKASPSKGVIAPDFDYKQIALTYQAAGADCLSVLTEPAYFLGAANHLAEIKQTVSIPVLRKDFIIDAYQIYQSSMLGADAILLIAAILKTEQMAEYIQIADALGISCLVEAHDEREIHNALKAGARIIGVNNRNLKDFQIDVSNSIRLRKLVPQDILFVSESGIRTRQDIEQIEVAADAVLIGETLMRQADKKAALDQLKGLG